MLFQYSEYLTDTYWLFSVGLLFGLSLVLAYLTEFSMESVLGWMVVVDGFLVWAELMELWTLVLLIVVLLIWIGIRGKAMIQGGL